MCDDLLNVTDTIMYVGVNLWRTYVYIDALLKKIVLKYNELPFVMQESIFGSNDGVRLIGVSHEDWNVLFVGIDWSTHGNKVK